MRKRKSILFLLLVIVICIFTACSTNENSEKTISVYVGSEPESIDPAYNQTVDGATLLIHAFEGLMTLDKDGKPMLGQAEKYSISDDGLTYTFTLRDDIKWSDGDPVKADDFIYAWKRAIEYKNATVYGYLFDVIVGAGDIYGGVEGVTMDDFGARAIDDKTIEITLIAPTPYFLELCAYPTYFPVREDIVEDNDSWTINPDTYITNGPYKLESWTHNSEMIYVKNENYYKYKDLGPDQIKFVLMTDANAVLAAFQNGDILFSDDMPNEEIDAWREKPEFNIEGELGTYYISFNTEKEPFDNFKVRQALSLAIDRNFIVEQIGRAGQQPAPAFIPTGLTDADVTKEFRDVGGDYYSVAKGDYEKNLREAKKLLAEAGYPEGKGFPKFEYMYNPEGSTHALIGQALQDMWKELGIECTLVDQEWNTFLQIRQDGNYQVARNGWGADYDDPITFIDMFLSNSGHNNSQWKNAEYDKIVNKIKNSFDTEERFELMHEAEDLLMQEAPIAPIFYYVDIFLKSEKLEGFYSSPLGFKYFMYSSVSK
ncbi:peptide ABC transporter substrate-binding protein [Alkalibaculum sporogenes]|uniref:peptide ABC transporter substrate-binding protein n=1 Tax=Alkalibaculum sporogenes TaxID=2655001 RepID=UPI00187BBFDB|nr:peptide ABC transporter substrate-binding protein [Alkalibaculum sporogenes]